MCWSAYKGKYILPHVAKRNIKVVKVVNYSGNEILPFFYSHKLTYELNKRYDTTLNIENVVRGKYVIIDNGFHSYSNTTEVLDYLTTTYNNDSNVAIMHCIIPKGTTYYLNRLGEYVSESIIPISIEKI